MKEIQRKEGEDAEGLEVIFSLEVGAETGLRART